MKKWMLGLIAALLLTAAFPISANAVEARALTPNVTLYFEGTTAYCTAVVLDGLRDLNVTMTLWHGNTRVGSWSGSGRGYVFLEGNCPVVKGETYTLIVTGTTNGVSFSSTPFSRVC